MRRCHSTPVISHSGPSTNRQPSTTETETTTEGLGWDPVHARFLLFLFCCTLALTAVHISFLPAKEILKQKSTDTKVPVYTLLGIIAALVAALGFGQPYSPAAITTIGFFANFFTCLFLPGIMDWFEKLVLLAVIYALFLQYCYKWRNRIFSWLLK